MNGEFSGSLDGAGYTIHGINISTNQSNQEIGIFSTGLNCVVKNLKIADISIYAYSTSNRGFGSLFGSATNCNITNITLFTINQTENIFLGPSTGILSMTMGAVVGRACKKKKKFLILTEKKKK